MIYDLSGGRIDQHFRLLPNYLVPCWKCFILGYMRPEHSIKNTPVRFTCCHLASDDEEL